MCFRIYQAKEIKDFNRIEMGAKVFLNLLLFVGLLTAQKCREANPEITPEEAFVWQTPAHFGYSFSIPKDNPLSKEGIELGRMLFYEKALSKDSSISCASCHQQSRAFTDGRAFSVGIRGQILDRSAMSLVNLLWVDRFFWDGRAPSLEKQALIPLQDLREMDLNLEEAVKRLENAKEYRLAFKKAFGSATINPEQIAKAMAQFERTLISDNSRYDRIIRGEVQPTERELRAINLFMTHPVPEINIRGGNCGDCHGSHLITLNAFHNNGLDSIPKDPGLARISADPYDLGKMRAPSLRNIALTAPYMHDGRFKTLEEVLDHYNEHLKKSDYLDILLIEATNEPGGESLLLSKEEKQDLIFFMQMLTDSSFISNSKFSNPFISPKN